MGMVVIQPYISVSKLKKIKTKFLRCTGYPNFIKTGKARFRDRPLFKCQGGGGGCLGGG